MSETHKICCRCNHVINPGMFHDCVESLFKEIAILRQQHEIIMKSLATLERNSR